MSVQYKTSEGWKNISSSSNNAVDTVADGNMNPVTSNAVYDALNTFETIPITPNSHVTSGTITCKKCGHLVEVNLQYVITDLTDGNTIFASGFPKPAINVRYNSYTVHTNSPGVIGSVNISQSGDMDTAWAEKSGSSQYITYHGSFTYLSA